MWAIAVKQICTLFSTQLQIEAEAEANSAQFILVFIFCFYTLMRQGHLKFQADI